MLKKKSKLLCAKLLQSCLTLCSPTDCSLPACSVRGILQAKILEWVAMPSSRVSSQTRDRTCMGSMFPALAGGFFTTNTTWEAQKHLLWLPSPLC